MPLVKLGKQRGCRLLPAPPGLSHRTCPGEAPRSRAYDRARSGAPAAGEAGPHLTSFAVLPGAGQAGAGEPRHREWQSRDGQSCSAACPRWGHPNPPRHRRQPEGTGEVRRGICEGFSSAETLRCLPALRAGAAAGESSRLSGTGGAQGALLRPSSPPQSVLIPFPPRSLCPGLAGGSPLSRFPAPRQAQGSGRARSTPVRTQNALR